MKKIFDIRRYNDDEFLELENLIATVFLYTKDKSTGLIDRSSKGTRVIT